MPDPICSPHLPVRPDELDADWVVTLASYRARVEHGCEPVSSYGPSFEETRREQAREVGSPVAALVARFRARPAAQQVRDAVALLGGSLSSMRRSTLAEALLGGVLGLALAEGEALAEARVRDAKVGVVLMLGRAALDSGFVTAALAARSRSTREISLILAEIDAHPGLRATLEHDVLSAVADGQRFVTAESLHSRADLSARLARACSAAQASAPGTRPSDTQAAELALLCRFEHDTAFRIGVHAALFRRAGAEGPTGR